MAYADEVGQVVLEMLNLNGDLDPALCRRAIEISVTSLDADAAAGFVDRCVAELTTRIAGGAVEYAPLRFDLAWRRTEERGEARSDPTIWRTRLRLLEWAEQDVLDSSSDLSLFIERVRQYIRVLLRAGAVSEAAEFLKGLFEGDQRAEFKSAVSELRASFLRGRFELATERRELDEAMVAAELLLGELSTQGLDHRDRSRDLAKIKRRYGALLCAAGRTQPGIDEFEDALALWAACNGAAADERDATDIAALKVDLSCALLDAGDVTEAADAAREAIRLVESHSDSSLLGSAYAAAARALWQSDLQTAAAMAAEAVHLAECDEGDESPEAEVEARQLLVHILASSERSPDFTQEVEAFARCVTRNAAALGSRRSAAQYLACAGAHLWSAEKRDDAIASQRRAVAIFRSLAESTSSEWRSASEALVRLYEMQSSTNRHDEAIRSLMERRSLLGRVASGDGERTVELARALTDIGVELERGARLHEALEPAREAVELLAPVMRRGVEGAVAAFAKAAALRTRVLLYRRGPQPAERAWRRFSERLAGELQTPQAMSVRGPLLEAGVMVAASLDDVVEFDRRCAELLAVRQATCDATEGVGVSQLIASMSVVTLCAVRACNSYWLGRSLVEILRVLGVDSFRSRRTFFDRLFSVCAVIPNDIRRTAFERTVLELVLSAAGVASLGVAVEQARGRDLSAAEAALIGDLELVNVDGRAHDAAALEACLAAQRRRVVDADERSLIEEVVPVINGWMAEVEGALSAFAFDGDEVVRLSSPAFDDFEGLGDELMQACQEGLRWTDLASFVDLGRVAMGEAMRPSVPMLTWLRRAAADPD